MTIDPKTLVPEGITHSTAADVQFSKLPYDERMKVHRTRLRAVGFGQGVEGVREYKARYPEAKSIRVNIGALAYSPKPKGYDEYLASLVAQWLADEVALNSTNMADVERLNAHFGTARFDPAKQFSLPLPKGAKAKIEQVFAARGVSLDTASIKSMSAVRRIAKAVRAGEHADKRAFGKFGIISDDVLTLGHRGYPIERHKGRECIRVTADGATQRLYLTTLRVLLESIEESDPLLSSSSRRIGEVAPGPELASDRSKQPSHGACSPGEGRVNCAAPSLRERVARLKGLSGRAEQAGTPAPDTEPDADPLAF
jgi:hypothetical protein